MIIKNNNPAFILIILSLVVVSIFILNNEISNSYGQAEINKITDIQPFYTSINSTFISKEIVSIEPNITKENWLEYAFISNVGQVINNETFIDEYLLNDKIIGKGTGVISTNNGSSISYEADDIGVGNNNGTFTYIGIISFKSANGNELSFLNNTIGIYENSNSVRQIWLWK